MINKLLVAFVLLPISLFAEKTSTFEHLRIELPLRDIVSIDEIDIEIPLCKYDKDFALTFTGDDALMGIYQRAFNYIHANYIDDTNIFHDYGKPMTTGFTPERKLVSTDGCGTDIPFRLCVNWFSCDPGKVMHDNGNIYTAQMWWSEGERFTDFHNGILNHGGAYEKEDVNKCIDYNFNQIKEQLGISSYILGVPGGSKGFPEAADNNDNVYFMEAGSFATSEATNTVNFESFTKENVLKSRLPRNPIDTKEHSFINSFIEKKAQKNSWINLFCHDIKNSKVIVNGQLNADTCFNMLDHIYDNYGKGGKDNVWFASSPEILEYQYLRLNSIITKEILDDKLILKIDAASLDGFYFKEMTFKIKGIGSCANMILSENISGYSFNSNENETLININYSERNIKLAEKYIDKVKVNNTEKAISEAKYFIESLRPDLREKYLKELEVISSTISVLDNNEIVCRYDGQNIVVSENLKSTILITRIDGSILKEIQPIGATQLISVPKGIYIINKQKMIVY